LAAALRAIGLTAEQFSSDRFTRLRRIRHLVDGGMVDESLRWTSAREAA
jgi:hypothetical protein